MDDTDYEIIPQEELKKLKREIEKLRGRNSESPEYIQDSVDKLNDSINKLLEIFVRAADEFKDEQEDEEFISKNLDPFADQLDTIIEQNNKLAKGVVALSDDVKSIMSRLDNLESKSSTSQSFPRMPSNPVPPSPPQQQYNPQYNYRYQQQQYTPPQMKASPVPPAPAAPEPAEPPPPLQGNDKKGLF
ncbi:hypothetical protein K9M79_04225 [Candidatus Woesearchaeota archaeon]|nr:hypothetical protein [Candidatus Woesearchaeota archaeon]